MTAKVILNPYAARWKAGKQREAIEAALQDAGVAFELVSTETRGHGTALAAEAVRLGFDPIISAGGDGSLNEVLNGILQGAKGGKLPVFGLIPLGTANDLVDNLGMPRGIYEAVAIIAEGRTRAIDLCEVNGQFFLNNAGIGLEPTITLIQQNMTWAKGIAHYLLATLTAIGRNPHWQMQLAWEGGDYEGPVTLVSIGNLPRTGGIFYTVPDADAFDGQLSFVYGYIPNRAGILKVLPKIMKAGEGNYVEHPAVHQEHSPWLTVRVTPNSPAHADGELFTHAGNEFNYRVHPRGLHLLTSA
ncbi:MAG: diacylglycerol kinase family lipid kinase [Chloroflexi bacterium]|nr:diacylglycerol kinase family lipid kinase [Chloroflexota bacterium]